MLKSLILGAIILSASSSLALQSPKRLPPRPRPATTVFPSYPPIARAACAQGQVAVIVEIDSAGKVVETDVLYGHPLLWPNVVTAARGWVFDAAPGVPELRREVLRFGFRILPFEVAEKKLKPVWAAPNDVEIRVHPLEPSCDDCTEKRRRQLRRGGCPPQT
jgi:Gram-negative bacterial TonB protein C-terminal